MAEFPTGRPDMQESRKQDSLLYGSVIYDARENTLTRIGKLSQPDIYPHWPQLGSHISERFGVSQNEGEFYAEFIKEGIQIERAGSWQEALRFVTGDDPLAGADGFALNTTPIPDAPTRKTRPYGEVAGANAAIYLYVDELKERQEEKLMQAVDYDDIISYQIEMGQYQQYSEPFTKLYHAFGNGHLLGKYEENEAIRKTLDEEQKKKQKLKFIGLFEQIGSIKTYHSAMGHAEGLSYVLGEDNQIAEIARRVEP
jgi:hypothetical protein